MTSTSFTSSYYMFVCWVAPSFLPAPPASSHGSSLVPPTTNQRQVLVTSLMPLLRRGKRDRKHGREEAVMKESIDLTNHKRWCAFAQHFSSRTYFSTCCWNENPASGIPLHPPPRKTMDAIVLYRKPGGIRVSIV